MKKLKLVCGLAFCLFSFESLACVVFPKSISLADSPFMFKKFEMNAHALTINDVKGHPAHFSCDREKNIWTAQFTNEFGQTTNSIYQDQVITDSDENPVRTEIHFYSNKDGCLPRFDGLELCESITGPYLTIKDLMTDKAIVVQCTKEESADTLHKIKMSLSIYANQKKIADTSVTELQGVRGMPPRNSADGEIDMNSKNYSEIKFSGCGAGSLNTGSKNTGGVR